MASGVNNNAQLPDKYSIPDFVIQSDLTRRKVNFLSRFEQNF